MVGRNTEMPNFLVIGAAKCGTTSLHYYLDLHPEISMSLEKEPAFFVPADSATVDLRITDLPIYLGLFAAGTAIRGESSTAYSRFPVVPGVPEAVAAQVPDTKLIYLVRDPVDRVVAEVREALSNRMAEMKHVPAEVSLRDLLGDIEDPANRFTCPSLYMTQIRQYLDHFPADSMLILDSDDLRSKRIETVARIFRFLGVEDDFRDERMGAELNTAADKRRRSELYVRLSEVALFQELIDRMSPRVKRDSIAWARRLFSRKWEPPALDDDLRLELEALYRPEVEELREFTGQGFPGWSI